jgi:hypothetical protein
VEKNCWFIARLLQLPVEHQVHGQILKVCVKMSQNDFLFLLEQTFEWNTFVIVIAEERSINKIYEKMKYKQGTFDG